MKLLTAYWEPGGRHSLADALHEASQLVAQLFPPPLRLRIAAQLDQHIDGHVQNLLLGDRAALPPDRSYEAWVGDASQAMAGDKEDLAMALLQIVGQTFNLAIWRLRQAHNTDSPE